MEKRIVSYENDTAIIEEFKTITITRDYLEAKAIELKERRDVANHQANEAANEIQVIAEEEIELAKAQAQLQAQQDAQVKKLAEQLRANSDNIPAE